MSYYSTIMRNGSLRYYRFGEASGTTAKDSSGNGQNGTVTGTVTLGQAGAIKGDPGTSMLFDGSSGYVSVPSLSLTDATIEMWIYVTNFADDGGGVSRRPLINNIDGTKVYQLSLQGGNSAFVWAVNDSSGQSITSIASNTTSTWYHLAGTFVAASHTVTLYVNGAVAANNGGAVGFGIGSVGFNVGRRADGSGYFPGQIQHVAVYSKILSADQIKNDYQTGVASMLIRPQHRGIGRIV